MRPAKASTAVWNPTPSKAMSSLAPSGAGEQSNMLAARQLPFLRPQSQSCTLIHTSTSMLSTSLHKAVAKSNRITAADECYVAGPQKKVSLRYLYLPVFLPLQVPKVIYRHRCPCTYKTKSNINHNLTAAYPEVCKKLMLLREGGHQIHSDFTRGLYPMTFNCPLGWR